MTSHPWADGRRMVGDPARLAARASSNGGHGNDRPTRDGCQRLAVSGWALKGRPETGGLAGVMKTFGSQVSAIGSLVQLLRFGYWSRA